MILNPGLLSQLYKNYLAPISKIRVFDTKNISSYFKSANNINFLQNGSFEDWIGGLPSGWTIDGQVNSNLSEYEVIQSQDRVFGQYSLAVLEKIYTWDEILITWDELENETWDYVGEVSAYALQNFVVSSDEIHFGANIKGQGYFGVEFFDSENILTGQFIYGFSSNNFSEIKKSVLIPENSAYGRIIFGFEAPQTGFLVDGVFVSDNPNFIFGLSNLAAYDEIIPIDSLIRKEIGKNASADIKILKENRFAFLNGKFGILDKNNIIEVFVGYKDKERNIEYLQKVFVGYISKMTSQSDYEISLNCIDFSEKFKSCLNEGFPNFESYRDMPLDAGFKLYREEIKRDMYPMGYDNWLLENVIRDLCIKAGFPLDFADIFPSNIRLSVGSETYPFSTVDGNDKMFYQFDFGSTLWEIIGKLAEEFGYFAGFDHNGRFKFYPVGHWQIHVPDEIVFDNNFKLETNKFSVDNPTWRYITNEDNPGVGEIYIPEIKGSNFRLYTIGEQSDGIMNFKIFYDDENGNPVVEDVGDIEVKGIMDDGSSFFSNYIDIFVNDNKYIGGKLIGTMVSGTIAIGGYGFNSDNLSSPQFDFTSVNDITSRQLEVSSEDIRNEVIVIGETRTGRDIAVKAIDEWSIFGGRKLTVNDLIVSADPAKTNLSVLFNNEKTESVIFDPGDSLKITLRSEQMVTGINLSFDMGFGSKVSYTITDEHGEELYTSSKISESSAGNIRIIEDDSTYNREFYLGNISGIPFVATDYEIYFVTGEEKFAIDFKNGTKRKKIIDVSEIGDYLFVLTPDMVYRYNFLTNTTEEFSSVGVTISPVKYIIARTASEAVVLTENELYKTSFGISLIKFDNFSLANTDYFDTTEYPSNNKPVMINSVLVVPIKRLSSPITSIGSKITGSALLGNFTQDITNINSSPVVTISSETILAANTVFATKKGTVPIFYVNNNNGGRYFVSPNPASPETWEEFSMGDSNKVYSHWYSYENNSETYFYGKEFFRYYLKLLRMEKTNSMFGITLLKILDSFEYTEVNSNSGNIIYVNSGLLNSVDIFLETNGLYYNYHNISFEEASGSGSMINIEKPISEINIIFNGSFGGEIKVSEIEIYSRSIRSLNELQPSNQYNFENKTKPLFGSWDSLVGNTSDRSLPFYNYKTESLPPNYVGMKKTFVYKDGRLNNEALCLWMAQHLLHRYRKKFFEYDVSVFGNPLIELNDCVRFIDAENNMGLDNYFWVQGFDLYWGKETYTNFNVSNLKPLNSFQNFIDIYREDQNMVSGLVPAVINKDIPTVDSSFADGEFSITGINESTFVPDEPIVIDPFFESLGFSANINKGCRIILKIYNSENVLMKVINYDEFRAGDMFNDFTELPVYTMTSTLVWNDFGDFPLFLQQGNYSCSVEVSGLGNSNEEKHIYKIPFTVNYQYNLRSSIQYAKYNPVKGSVSMAVKTERKPVSLPDVPGNWEEFASERVLTLFKTWLYIIDTDEKETPSKVEEIRWSNNGAILQFDLSGINVNSGYKPIIVLGAIRDRGNRFSGYRDSNSVEFTIEEIFSTPPPANGLFWKNGHTDKLHTQTRYKCRFDSDREFFPFNIDTGQPDNLKLEILDELDVIRANGTYNISNGVNNWFSFKGNRVVFEPYGSNYAGMRLSEWGNMGPDISSIFNSVKHWRVQVTELKFWVDLEGWS